MTDIDWGLTAEALRDFGDSPNTLLKIEKDKDGRRYLVKKEKGERSGLAGYFGRGWKLKNIVALLATPEAKNHLRNNITVQRGLEKLQEYVVLHNHGTFHRTIPLLFLRTLSTGLPVQ